MKSFRNEQRPRKRLDDVEDAARIENSKMMLAVLKKEGAQKYNTRMTLASAELVKAAPSSTMATPVFGPSIVNVGITVDKLNAFLLLVETDYYVARLTRIFAVYLQYLSKVLLI